MRSATCARSSCRRRRRQLGFWGAVDHETLLVFALGCVLATPLVARRVEAALRDDAWWPRRPSARRRCRPRSRCIFVASVAKLAAGTYNPFIYFRF